MDGGFLYTKSFAQKIILKGIPYKKNKGEIKIRKILMITIIFITGLIVLTGCGDSEKVSNDSFSDVKERGYVVMGLDDTFAPMGFRDESGEIVGFDVDLAKAVFDKLGLELKLQPIDWSMKETELNAGNIDVIWNGYTITEERKEKVAFTKPYIGNRQIIITLKGLNIETKEDLQEKKVAAQTGSSAVDAINKFSDIVSTFDGGEIIVFDTNNEAFMDLEAGRVDAVVADEILARYYISKRGSEKYNISEDDFGKEEYGIGLRKGDKKFLKEINTALDQIKSNNEGEKISNKWFGENILK